jgi:hypothetical protein
MAHFHTDPGLDSSPLCITYGKLRPHSFEEKESQLIHVLLHTDDMLDIKLKICIVMQNIALHFSRVVDGLRLQF